METTGTKSQVNQTNDLFFRIFKSDLEANRFESICVILLLVGCLGGLVVGTGALSNIYQLLVTAYSTIAVLSLILAVQKMKLIVKTTIPIIFLLLGLLIYNIMSGLPFLTH